ncbi:hypothetical protein SEA_POISE_102 [Mycobacterium phage Poise]|uniref:Uncharacterized protein n=2 Tax=Marvinvirus mosmoris TaxID=1982093 RepID=A0A5P8D5Z7_9CAUD|nr:hypothetical protein SEA_REDRAIDER77_101 [Mycobacterium phage RedRaider77]QFP94428.1 hypothetical protein SEA_POISE_102 [Mycobacterium phage Poise]
MARAKREERPVSESTPSDLYACKQKTVLLVASRWWRVIGIDEQGNEHITLETSNEKSAHWGLENCPYPKARLQRWFRPPPQVGEWVDQ